MGGEEEEERKRQDVIPLLLLPLMRNPRADQYRAARTSCTSRTSTLEKGWAHTHARTHARTLARARVSVPRFQIDAL